MLAGVFTRSVMDKNTNSGPGVKSVEKKLESKCDLLGANQELRRPPTHLLPEEPGGEHLDGDASFT
jgi:hypothetical protein